MIKIDKQPLSYPENELHYQGFVGEFHPKTGTGFYGSLKLSKDVVTFQTDSNDIKDLDVEFRKSVDDYIEFSNES